MWQGCLGKQLWCTILGCYAMGGQSDYQALLLGGAKGPNGGGHYVFPRPPTPPPPPPPPPPPAAPPPPPITTLPPFFRFQSFSFPKCRLPNVMPL